MTIWARGADEPFRCRGNQREGPSHLCGVQDKRNGNDDVYIVGRATSG